MELAEENLIDAKAIVKRLTKLFNGELSSEFVTKQGQVIDVPITFKNQIEAKKKSIETLEPLFRERRIWLCIDAL